MSKALPARKLGFFLIVELEGELESKVDIINSTGKKLLLSRDTKFSDFSLRAVLQEL